ncbi:MAG: response regulator [Spirochaetales bacterium]|nr:response regulator [Spirochaetales bacterium]
MLYNREISCWLSPPFATTRTPILGPLLLQTIGESLGFKTSILHLNLLLASLIGVTAYEGICYNQPFRMLGERLFARSAHDFPPLGKNTELCDDPGASVFGKERQYDLSQFEYKYYKTDNFNLTTYLEIEKICFSLINCTAVIIASMDYQIIGCSSSWEQNNASASFLKKIKKAAPHVLTIMGGSNCEGEMNVLTAHNGKEGLQVLGQKIPVNLIITDVMMPVMDGYDFVASVKKERAYNNIPILFLTARSGIDESIRGLSSGAVDYVTKPFSVKELKAKVDNLTRIKASQKEDILNRVIDSLNEKTSLPGEKPDYNKICRDYNLSERQQEIFFMIIEGLTNKEITSQFDIAESTIRRHISDIYKKFDCTTRMELINELKKLMG